MIPSDHWLLFRLVVQKADSNHPYCAVQWIAWHASSPVSASDSIIREGRWKWWRVNKTQSWTNVAVLQDKSGEKLKSDSQIQQNKIDRVHFCYPNQCLWALPFWKSCLHVLPTNILWSGFIHYNCDLVSQGFLTYRSAVKITVTRKPASSAQTQRTFCKQNKKSIQCMIVKECTAYKIRGCTWNARIKAQCKSCFICYHYCPVT